MQTRILNSCSSSWVGAKNSTSDALAELTRALDEDVRPFLFWRAADGTTLLANGSVQSIALSATDEWRIAFRASMHDVRAQLPSDGLACFLVWFDPSVEGDESWCGFPHQYIFIPERMKVFEDVDRKDMGSSTVSDVSFVSDGKEFREASDILIDEIESGGLDKVVLARKYDVILDSPVSLPAVLGSLIERERECTVVLFSPEPGKAFISATPEHLSVVEQGRFRSEAVAGTDDFHSDALDNGKIEREHRHVVTAIEERAKEFCSSVHTAAETIRALTNVRHRVTPIEGTLKADCTLIDAVASLHPTPAVAGVPEARAMERIRTREPFSRGLYAGTIGWMDREGNGEAVVAIRSALIDGSHVSVFAGAGLVKGSDSLEEFRETEWKMQAMMAAIHEGST